VYTLFCGDCHCPEELSLLACGRLTGEFPNFNAELKSSIAYLDVMDSALTAIDIDMVEWKILEIVDFRDNPKTDCSVILQLKESLESQQIDTFLSSCNNVSTEGVHRHPKTPTYSLPYQPPNYVAILVFGFILSVLCLGGLLQYLFVKLSTFNAKLGRTNIKKSYRKVNKNYETPV
jgi:hypothetical protein